MPELTITLTSGVETPEITLLFGTAKQLAEKCKKTFLRG
jgi:hypothetical protein